MRLKHLTPAEFGTVVHLRLAPQGEAFAGPLEQVFKALQLAAASRLHHPFAIVDGELIVGFFVLREGSARPAWATANSMTLHNFRIGAAFQGRGYGCTGIELAGHWIRCNRPGIERLMLAVNQRNLAARRVYAKCGFVDTGTIIHGRIGLQKVLDLQLEDIIA